jgi:PAS domain S-box-containing protein
MGGRSGFSARIGHALEHSEHAVFVSTALDRPYLAVNDAACRLLGYSRRELLALAPRDLATRLPGEVDAIVRQLDETGHLRSTARLRRVDGAVVEIGYWGSRTRNGGHFLSITDCVSTARLLDGASEARDDAPAGRSIHPRDVVDLESVRAALHGRVELSLDRLEEAVFELVGIHEFGVEELVDMVRSAATDTREVSCELPLL